MEKVEYIFIFDLFDTLLKNIDFQIKGGIDYLLDNVLSKNLNRNQVYDYVDNFWTPKYIQRIKDETEIDFEDELIDLEKKFGIRNNLKLTNEDILIKVRDSMSKVELFPDTIEILEKLNKMNIPCYLLSNAIFRKKTMDTFISEYNLKKYFVETYYSADYGHGKPSEQFFRVVLNDINSKYKCNKIIFIGDTYSADVIGSLRVGIKPIWLNYLSRENNDNVLEAKSLHEALEKLKLS